jgi:polyvinyl alcohol dehydrogenase (cytochrome)
VSRTIDASSRVPLLRRRPRGRRRGAGSGWGLGLAVLLLTTSCGVGLPGGFGARAEWPHPGLDLANTRAAMAETAIRPGNVGSLGREWELAGVEGVTGTPLVSRGVVYATDWTGHVRALDADSGEELWSQQIGARVTGSVALDHRRVFAGAADGTLTARDRADGRELWTVPVDAHEGAIIFASPIHVRGLVLIGVGSAENIPQREPGYEFSFRGSMVAFDAETGEEVWRYWTSCGPQNAGQDNCPAGAAEGAGVSVWSSPAVDTRRGLVYFGTGQHYGLPTTDRSDAVIALDLRTGREVWTRQFTAGDYWTLPGAGDPDIGPDADVGASPSLFQVGRVPALGVGDKAGNFKVLNRVTGEVLWSRKLTDGSAQGGVMASAAVVKGWRMGRRHDVIFLTSNRGGQAADLVALDSASGAELWRVDTGGASVGPVTWANGVLYVADNTGRISAYAAADGERLWSWRVGVQAAGGIAVAGGMVYGGWGWSLFSDSPDGGLIAFSLDGEPQPEEPPDEPDGAAIYQQSCALCHSTDGTGGSGPSLVGIGDRYPVDALREIVRDGRGTMPAWEGELTPEEIDAVVGYIRTAWPGPSSTTTSAPTTTTVPAPTTTTTAPTSTTVPAPTTTAAPGL